MNALLVPKAWRALVVDDEPLARLRLRQLLVDVAVREGCCEILEAGSAAEALDQLDHLARDSAAVPLYLVFVDIHMPGMDGLEMAAAWRQRLATSAWSTEHAVPHLVFVTAHAQHALQAFELEALDYLTKPVNRERLAATIGRALRSPRSAESVPASASDEALLVEHRGQLQRIELDDVVYVRAELKYLTVRTEERSWLMSASLQDLEQRFSHHFVRVHRNALVSIRRMLVLAGPAEALRLPSPSLESSDAQHSERGQGVSFGRAWLLRLQGVEELLSVSRRQLPVVREMMSKNRS